MAKQRINNFKLGIFVITGLLVLVFALYMIGKDQSLFTSNFRLRARFRNVEGLMPGSNVRYSGIQTGTVKTIRILNDTTIEVTLVIARETRAYIRKNSFAAIGTEGLMGNKVLNITSNSIPAPMADENDILPTKPQGNISDAMNTLYKTNDDASIVAAELVQTIRKINASPVLGRLLNDTSLNANLNASLTNIRSAAVTLDRTSSLLEMTLADLRRGKGTVGLLLTEEQEREKAAGIIAHLHDASYTARLLMNRLDSTAQTLQLGMNNKQGLVYTLLQDTALTGQLTRSMSHIEKGTAAFNEDMEALKHNFLTRGYFRKKERRSKQDTSGRH